MRGKQASASALARAVGRGAPASSGSDEAAAGFLHHTGGGDHLEVTAAAPTQLDADRQAVVGAEHGDRDCRQADGVGACKA